MAFASLAVRRWPLFVVFGLVGLAAAYVVTASMPRRYQSTVTLQLNPAARSAFLRYDSGNSSIDTSPAAALAASYAEVLRSRSFGDVVVRKLQLPVAPETVAGAIDARLIPNTNILRVTVSWGRPEDAQQLAQSIAEIFIAENVQRQQDGGATHVQDLEQSAQQIQTRLSGLSQQRDRLDQAVSRGDLTRLTELNDLDTRLSALQTSYANLLVEINRTRTSLDTAAILDGAGPAQLVGVPPLSQALPLGLVAGLAIAAGLAFLWEHLADAIRAPAELVALTGTGPLVVIGHGGGLKGQRGEPAGALVTRSAPRSATAESFRTLRANLRLAALEHPLRSLVVTSAGPSEGKTTVSANLAAAFAQSGKRVLLVDADLRRPTAHVVLGVSNECGLVDALVAEHEPGQSGQEVGVVPAGLDNLWILPAGRVPPNPNDLLGSPTMRCLIERWVIDYDIVVLDTAPAGTVADALLLAEMSDASLLVARSGRTRRTALLGTLEALRGTGRPMLGVVLNDLKMGPLSRYSAYGYYYAGYYGKDAAADEKQTPRTNGHVQGAALPAPPRRERVERTTGTG